MPTYEYVCTDCENQWEEIQKISEDALKVCPKCGKSTAKRQISAGNFILKGGGWYADLYSSAKKPEAKTDSKTSTDATSTPTTSGDAKPAAEKKESAAPPPAATPAAKPETKT